MTERLRLVVFTGPAFSAVDRVFFERLAADPLLELVAIVVDEYRGKRKALPLRVTRSIAKHGPAWIVMKIEGRVRAVGRSLVDRANDAIHGRRPDVDWQPPAPLHRVADIHSEESLALVRSLSADLGVIAGGRILRDELLSIPRHGTLNIHKRRLPEYRGGGPVGYWEILAGETSLGISIHYATAKVDAGPILAEATIPIDECDTLASLSIKADLRGAQLYHQTLQRFAKGHRIGVAQDLTRGKTYRAPSDYEVARLERRLEQRAARAMDLHATPWRARVRVLLQFALLLPYLRAVKARFTKNRRAPVMIFFYHLVADRPLNDMCVRLPVFVTQVEFLRRHFALLTLDETVRRLAAGSNDELAACITFDDGYRENRWAIEYLRYFEVPAAFFVSTGHVRDGKAFEHDLRRGYSHALPMSEEEVAALTSAGFVVGSHGVHHEDFGALPAGRAIEVLQESRDAIEKMCGSAPTHFAFPKGKRGINITPETYDAALRIYPAIYSAYGGCSYPRAGRRHFVRRGHASDLFELSLAMSGYTGFRDCINGNAWSKRTDELDPRTNDDARVAQATQLSIALVAASPAIVGGQSVQATALIDDFRAAGHRVSFIPIDVRFPAGLRWMRRVPYLRTIFNQALYVPSLARIAAADVVHVFSASYWSFLLAPAPAVLAAKLFRKRCVLHYHSGEANDHLTRWPRTTKAILSLVDEIAVPSSYLQRVFESHGYSARVIPNLIDTSRFAWRERSSLAPRLLSVRNFEEHYRVDDTIRAFALMKRRVAAATLTLAGGGTKESQLRSLAADLGVADDIQFAGSLDPIALRAAYDAADVFVNSSIIDNQPVSILEALASGLPVVSTPTGDIAAMLCGGEAGVLVDANDPQSMADAVERLLRDPALATALSRRGRAEAERYTSRFVREQWTALYAELLGRSRAARQGVVTHGV